ncbi:MAG: pyridoxal-phosphate dependent enzyme [Thermoplasmata archaeon]
MSYGIGNTPLIRARNLEKKFGAEKIYLKLEGYNPTGTHKDRLAIQHVDDAIIRGYDCITVGSCGNYGLALSYVACKSDLRCRIFLPEKYSGKLVESIKKNGADVEFVEGGYEDSVRMSRTWAEKDGCYDANPGKKNTPTSLVAYVDIAEEIQEQLDQTPTTISVPVGNGTTLAGIHLGYRLLWRKKRSEDIPKMLGASSRGNNAVIETIERGGVDIIELDPDQIQETDVNEALLNWKAYDGQEAVNAIIDTDGIGVGLTDDELLRYRDILKGECLRDVLPVSAAPLGALKKYLEDGSSSGLHVLIITSGEKSCSE